MTNQALLLRWFPLLLFAGMALISFLGHFNGLYGQDGHEYLRQSQAIFDRWNQGIITPATVGDAEFVKGYPLAGALLRYLVSDPILALQVVSWLAFAAAAFLLERILGLLAHGSRADSRLAFVGIGFVMAPAFLRSGLTVMSDALGLALALAAFYFGLRWIENERSRDTVYAAFFIALTVSVRIGLAGLMLPLAFVIGWFLMLRGKWRWLAAAVVAGIIGLLPYFWLKTDLLSQPLQHSLLQHWSPVNLFHRTFQNGNGFSQYYLPNILYLAFPLVHPGFCILLPGLFLLAKKTDLVLPAKKTIVICLAPYLLLLGGLPHQNLRYLLPVYTLLLLLLFPAWDRMYCYGFYFFKRLTWFILGAAVLLQVCFSLWILSPTVARNRLETTIATEIRGLLPAEAVVYSFDLDIALQSYLPDVEFRNLLERRYGDFPAGTYVLFNEPKLRRQWAEQNPMLNWGDLAQNYALETLKVLPEGWELYRIKGRK